jgi:3-oxoacyl-[acyl-carrier-protein] synthase II
MGESVGIMALEPQHARSRGLEYIGAGYGMTADAYHMTSPAPEEKALRGVAIL